MLAAITPLSDFDRWARTSALEIVMFVSGAILITRLAGWTSQKVTGRIDRHALGGDALVRSEAAKHRHAVIAVVTWTFLALAYFVTGVLVIQRLGVPLTSLVAPATVAGVALGFGAQRVVQDVLAGFFIVAERQYGFGDSIRVSALGATTGVVGVVEEVTLRVTRLRTVSGEVVFIPNGQIVQVTNLSRDWARAVIDVPVPATADVSAVTAQLREVGENAFSDDRLRPLLLDAPSVMGLESIAVDQYVIRMVARTLPGKQFDVSRVLRVRIAEALQRIGVNVPAGVETADPESEQEPAS
jgi:moderate conductance mechanosensitive channel